MEILGQYTEYRGLMFRKTSGINLIPRIKIIGDGLTEYYYFKHIKKLKYQRVNKE
jgi:hypothetical protein